MIYIVKKRLHGHMFPIGTRVIPYKPNILYHAYRKVEDHNKCPEWWSMSDDELMPITIINPKITIL